MTAAPRQLARGFGPPAPPERSGAQRRDCALRRLGGITPARLVEMRTEAGRIACAMVTADDLRPFAGALRRDGGRVPRSSNAAGAIFRGAQWVQVGWIKSTKPTHNGTDLRVWGLRQSA